jgi:hypothetical protein
MDRTWAVSMAAVLVLAGGGTAGAQGATWVHAAVETRGVQGEQVTTFRAFTTTDESGTRRVPVARLCVKGIAHQIQEKCGENTEAVELTERTVGLPGVGNLCVEAVAHAESPAGPLTATARACP